MLQKGGINLPSRKKVTRYSKPFNINMGIIVFGIILIYIIINSILFFTKEQLSVYAIDKKYKIADDVLYTGLVIRDEKIIYNNTSGYISYFLREGERVSKNHTVYTVDQTGSIYEEISAKDVDEGLLEKEDMEQIDKQIDSFKANFSNNKFEAVYDFKYGVENTVLEIVNYSMVNNLEDVLKNTVSNSSFKVVNSSNSGIISYIIDNMENIKPEDVTEDTFNITDYKRTQLRTSNLIESGSPVYKLVTSEYWSVIIILDKDTYDKILEKTSLKIKFVKDDVIAVCDSQVYEKDGKYFAKLDFKDSMVRYISDRYLDIEIILNSAQGLKIPLSSIIEKNFYKIPLEYFMEGADTGSRGVTKEVYSENGELSYNFISTEIYYNDGEYGYVDTNTLNAGDNLRKLDSSDKFQVGITDKLIGVYNVNKGYSVFKRIEKLYENNEYCIVKDDTEYGLSLFDHIILNAKLAVEQALIY